MSQAEKRKDIGVGALAGLTATVPMSLVMMALHRWPRREPAPLPPHQITRRAAQSLDMEKKMGAPDWDGATVAAHFGYGAAAGALFGSLAGGSLSGGSLSGASTGDGSSLGSAPSQATSLASEAFKGAAFGFLVWALSYLGWVPAAGILRPATQLPARRNLLMIVAHLVWGGATGLLFQQWQKSK